MKLPPDKATECPHCGFIGPSKSECPRCGIVFDKLRDVEASSASGSMKDAVRAGQQPIPGPKRFTLLPWLVGLIAVIAVVAGFDASQQNSPAPAPPRPLPTDPPPAEEVLPAPQPTRPVPAVIEPISEFDAVPQPAVKPEKLATPSYTWYEGASGFERGIEEAQQEGKALAVYFYTDWCPYCRELERDLLSRAKVEDFLKYLVKIRVNPERGRRERMLANEYGVNSYPSFFVQSAPGGTPRKIRRTDRDGLKSPEDFVATLERAAGN